MNDALNDAISVCPVCQRDLSNKGENDRSVHINSCLDLSDPMRLLPNAHLVQMSLDDHFNTTARPRGRTRAAKVKCPICGKLSTATHVKKCQKDHHVLPRQTVNLMRFSVPESPEVPEIPAPVPLTGQATAVNHSEVHTNYLIGQALPLPVTASTGEVSSAGKATILCEKNTLQVEREILSQTIEETQFKLTIERPETETKLKNVSFGDLPELKLIKKDRQTKLRVTRKRKTTKKDEDDLLDKGLLNDAGMINRDPCKVNYVITLKTQPNPIQKANMEGRLLLNHTQYSIDEHHQTSLIWRLSTGLGEPKDYICKGFEEFCQPPNLKNTLTGFFAP